MDVTDFRKSHDWHRLNKEKREKVLEKIKPLCELFNITEYDYEIKELSEDGYGTEETLVLDGQRIGCTCNSVECTFYEAVGYVIVERYCRNRRLGPFEKQTINYIKSYWKN